MAEQSQTPPDDYKQYVAFMEAGGGAAQPDAEDSEEGEAAAAAEEQPESEQAEEAGQTAEESETSEEEQQGEEAEGESEGEEEAAEEEDSEEEEPKPARPKGGKIARRMRKLTGEIAELRARLERSDEGEAEDEEAPEEVASSTDSEDGGATELVRPQLKDFEDNEDTGQSAWDQYEEKVAEYNKKLTDATVQKALDAQRKQLDTEHARTQAQAEWNRAASRFPDFNEVVRAEVKISPAMEAVMRLDPEEGTALAYYLGQHPEESERIARVTLAENQQQWTVATTRAGIELGKLSAKIATPLKADASKSGKPSTTAPPKTKHVTSAHRPPATVRGGTQPPKATVNDDALASNFKKWNAERERQLSQIGKR